MEGSGSVRKARSKINAKSRSHRGRLWHVQNQMIPDRHRPDEGSPYRRTLKRDGSTCYVVCLWQDIPKFVGGFFWRPAGTFNRFGKQKHFLEVNCLRMLHFHKGADKKLHIVPFHSDSKIREPLSRSEIFEIDFDR